MDGKNLEHVAILGDRGNMQEDYVNDRLKGLKEEYTVTVLSVIEKDIWRTKYENKEIDDYVYGAGDVVNKLRINLDFMYKRIELMKGNTKKINTYNENSEGKKLSGHIIVMDDLDMLLGNLNNTELEGYVSYVLREFALKGENVGIVVYYIGVGINENPHAKQLVESSGDVYVFPIENTEGYGDLLVEYEINESQKLKKGEYLDRTNGKTRSI